MPYQDKQKQKEAQRKHYLNNKSKYRDSLRKRKKRNKEFVYSMKMECLQCGLKDKVCLDFHHLGDKHKNVSKLINEATTIDKLRLEIKKCETLCGNCHRKKHHPEDLPDGSGWKNFNAARIRKRKWFIDFIGKSKCCGCSEKDQRCLEFHHLRDKKFTISYLLTSGHSLEYLKKEIDKCEILCTNCHRKKHQAGVAQW